MIPALRPVCLHNHTPHNNMWAWSLINRKYQQLYVFGQTVCCSHNVIFWKCFFFFPENWDLWESRICCMLNGKLILCGLRQEEEWKKSLPLSGALLSSVGVMAQKHIYYSAELKMVQHRSEQNRSAVLLLSVRQSENTTHTVKWQIILSLSLQQKEKIASFDSHLVDKGTPGFYSLH